MKECFRRRERKQYNERRAAAAPMVGLRHMCVEKAHSIWPKGQSTTACFLRVTFWFHCKVSRP